MKTFKVPTIWGEEPDPPEAPSTPIQLPIPEKIIPWQQLQIAQNEHFMRFTKNRTIEVLGKLYEPVLGEIDWEMEGIYNCRVKGNICYGKDYQDLRSLTTHLQGQMHRVSQVPFNILLLQHYNGFLGGS